jgi:hypothetical protein
MLKLRQKTPHDFFTEVKKPGSFDQYSSHLDYCRAKKGCSNCPQKRK